MKKINMAALVAALCALVVGVAQAADNSIKQVQVRRDGDQVLLKVQLASPLKTLPGNWSVVDPPRVVFDFPETDNQSGQASQQIATGDLKSLNLVQAEKLTRLVLNLYRPTKFSTEMAGDVLFIRLDSQAPGATQDRAPSVYQPTTPAKAAEAMAGDLATIRDVVFRRGEDGQALITVDLTDGSIPIDIRRSGAGLTIDLRDAELPERLQNRRDLNDFATPATTLTASPQGNNSARINVAARGRWFHQAHLTNNQLVVEIKPIPADDASKLVQTGQQGQKISINFYDADSAMVLRTLAEISGKNVMIDPSLSGRRVTANLDNIPYDQALEIIMSQVNAGMRVRNDVVLFGDRAVLQKRDQDTADELARAADTAPLVAETFKLNYVKASDVVSLVNNSFAQTEAPAGGGASGGNAPAGAAGVGGAAPAAAGGGGAGGKGMLSSRGGISIHAESNQVFVRDTAQVVEAIREVIRNIDTPPKQVLIEARIVEASTGFVGNLGVRLGVFNNQNDGYRVPGTNTRVGFGTSLPTTFTNLDIIGNDNTRFALSNNHTVFRPSYSLASAGNFGMMLFNAAATKLVTMELQASESDSKNKTVSSPRLVTMNRKAATISSVQQVTIVTGVNAQTGLPIYQTFSAPLTLGVTPSINPDNRISLELNIAKSTITNATTGSLDTNTVRTSVIVENGGTLVIGGFARESEVQTQERVPFLGDLPYVGFLFKTTSKNQSRSELLVFITPRIVNEAIAQR